MPKTLDGQLNHGEDAKLLCDKRGSQAHPPMAKDIKLIVVRNPVTRAISTTPRHRQRNPKDPHLSVGLQKSGSLGLIDASWSAIRIGIYALHLENWLQYFPLSDPLRQR